MWHDLHQHGNAMFGRIAQVSSALLLMSLLRSVTAMAQDVPGIEICTAEKTMERRTSCLQSNVDFLQKTITRLAADHQQKLDAAYRQIENLKSAMVGLQKAVEELPASQKRAADDRNKDELMKRSEPAPPAKEGAK